MIINLQEGTQFNCMESSISTSIKSCNVAINLLSALCRAASFFKAYYMHGLRDIVKANLHSIVIATLIDHIASFDCILQMAKQIADRDTKVRDAALNAITEAYFQVGRFSNGKA